MRHRLTCIIAVAGAACGRSVAQDDTPPPTVAVRRDSVVRIEERFITPFDTVDNIDSPAIYHHGDTHWVLASAKSTHVVMVYDASTGSLIRRIGQPGRGSGELQRPNGLAVVDSVLLVVERDNKRVQSFHLPSLQPLGSFGEGELHNPYGIAWVRSGPHAWTVYVTDNYEAPDETIPPEHELGKRIKQYRIQLSGEGPHLTSKLVRAFGDTAGVGALRIVESIAADSALGTLLVAEEDVTDSHLKVYDLEGKFTGRIAGRGLFPQQAEGMVLYSCGDTGGYWIATDQGETTNTFHVFERQSLQHVGSFTGVKTRLTDGVALTQKRFGPFPSGALYASHLDGGIAALGWDRIAAALSLRSDCRR